MDALMGSVADGPTIADLKGVVAAYHDYIELTGQLATARTRAAYDASRGLPKFKVGDHPTRQNKFRSYYRNPSAIVLPPQRSFDNMRAAAESHAAAAHHDADDDTDDVAGIISDPTTALVSGPASRADTGMPARRGAVAAAAAKPSPAPASASASAAASAGPLQPPPPAAATPPGAAPRNPG
jgi:hypothetical protein